MDPEQGTAMANLLMTAAAGGLLAGGSIAFESLFGAKQTDDEEAETSEWEDKPEGWDEFLDPWNEMHFTGSGHAGETDESENGTDGTLNDLIQSAMQDVEEEAAQSAPMPDPESFQNTVDGTSEADEITVGDIGTLVDAAEGEDTITGSTESDYVQAGADNDQVRVEGGNDTAAGGDGDDALSGGEGDDHLYGELGNDTLIGAEGDDSLYGNEGDDSLYGNSGADLLNGGAGDDFLAGAFSEVLTAEDTNPADTLEGGAGNDTLNIGAGDSATGGEGADLFSLLAEEPGNAAAVITDYLPGEDSIVLQYTPETDDEGNELDPELSVEPTEDGLGAQILLNGQLLATVEGQPDLAVEDITLLSN